MPFSSPDNAPYAKPVSDAKAPIDEDVYCLTCGYNLRGLCGDPVRCPECGDSNEIAALRLPAPMIRAALRRMETAPTLCVGCAFFCLFFGSVACVERPTVIGRAAAFAVGCAVVSVTCAVAWPFACVHTRRSFDARPGWGQVLKGFHMAGLLLTLCYPLSLAWAFAYDSMRIPLPPATGWLVLAISIASFVWGLRVYAATRRRMAVMRRDAAVRIATESLKKALTWSNRQ